ncbi:MAG: ribosomal protein S18 acetylase RimI-like enzyme [Candidatus Latescibacterota bacterium]|jgi:ribosomal protein S18 acetylase RimI-like enzyme
MHGEGYDRAALNCREKNTTALSLYDNVGYTITDTSSAYIKDFGDGDEMI